MKQYLEVSEYIDWQDKEVTAKAKALSAPCRGDEEVAEACFHFVRDGILHSSDYRLNPVTLKASDVLRYGTGYCYAKSHLLAALLRACGIPAGLCYQRLTIENDSPPFCLHGLNGVFLQEHGWYRMDARGNKPSVSAQFCPPVEKLAFPIAIDGEYDVPGVWSEPLEAVVQLLSRWSTYDEVAANLEESDPGAQFKNLSCQTSPRHHRVP